MFTSLATIRLLSVAEATMLSYLAPALMVLMGWALLGDRLDGGEQAAWLWAF
jgi:drug/metabolite transporter (DMT)-like permease